MGYYQMGQSKVSDHLCELEEAGLVREKLPRKVELLLPRRRGCQATTRRGGEPAWETRTRQVRTVMEPEARPKVLFLCTHNLARSQMAEGLLRHLARHRFEVYSAGTEATRVRPEAVAAMGEIGVDVSGQSRRRSNAT